MVGRRGEEKVLMAAAALAALGCLAAVLVIGRGAGPGALLQAETYDGLYHLHRVPRKRLARPLSDPIPAFEPSEPSRRQSLVMKAAKDRNRVDAIEAQLAKVKQQALAAHIAAAHRGLMAASRHGSARLFRLLAHEKQDDKKALAMASADFTAPAEHPSHEKQGDKKALAMASADFTAPAEHRTQLIPDYMYKRGGSVGDGSSSTQKTPAGDYYGQYSGGSGGVHTGTYGAVSGNSRTPLLAPKAARSGKPETAAWWRNERDARYGALGALDLVPEKDENVLGSLGGVETFDSRNRDGSLGGAGTDTNTMGSLFAVHAPSDAEEAADAMKNKPRGAVSFRYRQGHWSRDGLLWIVGLSLSSPLQLTKVVLPSILS
jgi:hypothetical protein